MLFFLACLGSQKNPPSTRTENISSEFSNTPEKTDLEEAQTKAETSSPQETLVEKAPLLEILVSYALPEKLKRNWPPEDWSYAKAYAYNFVPFGPGENAYVYRSGNWNERIEKTIDVRLVGCIVCFS